MKGQHFVGALVARGRVLHIPDLNPTTGDPITYSGMLSAFEAFADTFSLQTSWRLIGSSMGGIIAARWAELHPTRIDRLALLAPGFDLPRRWREQLGPAGVRDWKQRGLVDYIDAEGSSHQVRWELMADASTFAPFPVAACPTRILHGVLDQTVAIESSRRYAEEHANVELIQLEDNHRLMKTLDRVTHEVLLFFGLEEINGELAGDRT